MKGKVGLWGTLMILGLLVSSPSVAVEARCLDPKDIEEVLQAYQMYKPKMDGRGYDRVTTADPCDQDSFETRMIEAFIFLKQLPSFGSPSDEFDYGVLGTSALEFLNKRISTVFLDSEGGFCRQEGVAAYVSPWETRTMHICPFSMMFSSLVVSSVLVHEARHIDGFGHSICEHGDFAGQGVAACDRSYEQGGSYGVGAEFGVKIARSEEMEASLRQEARGMAVADLLERFNKMPLDMTSGALLFSTDGDLSFFNEESEAFLFKGTPDLILTKRAALPVFYDKSDGTVMSFFGTEELSPTDGSFAKDFREDFTQEKRMDLVDVYYSQSSCLLFQKFVKCAQGEKETQLNLPEGFLPLQFVTLKDSKGLRLFIASVDAQLIELPFSKDLTEWKAEDLMFEIQWTGWISLGFLPKSGYVGLNKEGILMQRMVGFEAWAPVSGFEGRIFQKMIAPFLWSEKLKGL